MAKKWRKSLFSHLAFNPFFQRNFWNWTGSGYLIRFWLSDPSLYPIHILHTYIQFSLYYENYYLLWLHTTLVTIIYIYILPPSQTKKNSAPSMGGILKPPSSSPKYFSPFQNNKQSCFMIWWNKQNIQIIAEKKLLLLLLHYYILLLLKNSWHNLKTKWKIIIC